MVNIDCQKYRSDFKSKSKYNRYIYYSLSMIVLMISVNNFFPSLIEGIEIFTFIVFLSQIFLFFLSLWNIKRIKERITNKIHKDLYDNNLYPSIINVENTFDYIEKELKSQVWTK